MPVSVLTVQNKVLLVKTNVIAPKTHVLFGTLSSLNLRTFWDIYEVF